MISKSVLMKREQLFNVVYKLIDEYHLYGHFYGNDGKLKSRYHWLYTNEDGVCVDSEGRAIEFDPCFDDTYGPEYDKYLDVHNCSVFSEWDREKIMLLSFDVILKDYLGNQIPKLIAMLRQGCNYANVCPVEKSLSDDYIRQLIAMAWKFQVAETINCKDFKHKLMGIVCDEDFYYKDYSWDKRSYARKLYEEDDNRKLSRVVVTRKELSKADTMERYRKARAEHDRKVNEILRIIGISTPKQVKATNEEILESIRAQLE